MRLPNWLAWLYIRMSMEVAIFKLWLSGMDRSEAKQRVAEELKLFMHKNVTPQFGDKK